MLDKPVMRVLFVAEAFGGGVFEITRTMAEGLSRVGYDVAIAFGRRPETPSDVRERISSAVEIFPLPWADRSVRAQLRGQVALRRLIRTWQPDVLHLMSSYAGVHGVLTRVRVPMVYTPSAYSFTMSSKRGVVRWAYLALESVVAAQVDVVGACSLSEGEHARALPTARSVAVVPNGIDELGDGAGVREYPAPRPRPRVVAIGRPLPQRQPEACARILDAVREYGEVCWLGGGSDDSDGTRALRKADVPMTGWTSRNEMLKSLASSTVYLHWTAWDGLPLSVLEAMSLDVVVVASDIGPNREVLGPDQVCRTEAQAIDLISRVLADATLRQRFIDGQRARRTLYGADRMVSGWSELYRTISNSTLRGRSAENEAGVKRGRSRIPARQEDTV